MDRDKLLSEIKEEREKQLNLPGSERDITKTPNDWVALISHYASRECMRNMDVSGNQPSSEDFKNSLEKSAAVILAALEHIDKMEENGLLK